MLFGFFGLMILGGTFHTGVINCTHRAINLSLFVSENEFDACASCFYRSNTEHKNNNKSIPNNGDGQPGRTTG
jgi:hypothetical protein